MPYTRRLTVQDVSVVYLDEGQTDTVNAGANDATTITAPSGYIYQILKLYIQITDPSGSTSGSHKVYVSSVSQNIGILYGKADFGNNLYYNYNVWIQANNDTDPNTVDGQVNALNNVFIDDTNGISFHYYNDTDANQTGERKYRLWVKKIKVA